LDRKKNVVDVGKDGREDLSLGDSEHWIIVIGVRTVMNNAVHVEVKVVYIKNMYQIPEYGLSQQFH
jgi:hypothetical protein